MGNSNAANLFALVGGAVYALVGLVGFVATGFDGVTTNGPDDLVGFDLNIFHNVVHLGVGLLLLGASRFDPSVCQGVVIGGGLILIVAALLGFLNEAQILSIDDEVAADNFLHLITGSVAVLFGLIGARQSDALRARRGPGARA
jgi:hypothetical protein